MALTLDLHHGLVDHLFVMSTTSSIGSRSKCSLLGRSSPHEWIGRLSSLMKQATQLSLKNNMNLQSADLITKHENELSIYHYEVYFLIQFITL
jgi:hypothetical protein